MRLLRVKEVANRLNVSLACVYALAESGILIGYRIGLGRGTWRFDEVDVVNYLNAAKNERKPPPRRRRAKRPQLFKHLDGDRLREAWRRQGVPVDLPSEGNAPSCE